MKRLLESKIFIYLIFAAFAASAIYGAIMLFVARAGPSAAIAADPSIRVRSDYISMLAASLIGIAVMLLPGLLVKEMRLRVPSFMFVVFAAFLFAAIWLGGIQNFYFKIPFWDTILHTFSGIMLGALAFSLVSILNDAEKIPVQLSPLFLVLFSFCFALALGALWEIVEFSSDSLLHTNMQRYAMPDGTPLVGHKALFDTMKDLLSDATGALLISIAGGFAARRKKAILDNIQIKK